MMTMLSESIDSLKMITSYMIQHLKSTGYSFRIYKHALISSFHTSFTLENSDFTHFLNNFATGILLLKIRLQGTDSEI